MPGIAVSDLLRFLSGLGVVLLLKELIGVRRVCRCRPHCRPASPALRRAAGAFCRSPAVTLAPDLTSNPAG